MAYDKNRASVGIIILAGGKGQRMRSNLPKVLHTINGKPMISFVIEASLQLNPQQVVVVVGHRGEEVVAAVRQHFAAASTSKVIQFATQKQQLGTADAVAAALPLLTTEAVIIVNGDAPLIRAATLRRLQQAYAGKPHGLVLLAFNPPDPSGYGRIVRHPSGEIRAIVEERELTADEKKLTESNAGFYMIGRELLQQAITQIMATPTAHEYYLTDVVAQVVGKKLPVVAVQPEQVQECFGINEPEQLAALAKLLPA